ncbi:MAG: hypothetical protein ACP6IY_18890 [Promethearchaeia archaeon]
MNEIDILERDTISKRKRRIKEIFKIIAKNDNKPYRYVISQIMIETGVSQRLAEENIKMFLLAGKIKIYGNNLRIVEKKKE